jgi:predicted nucleotidyltransferase
MIGDAPKPQKKYMKNLYKAKYEQLRQQPEVSDMLFALERGFQQFGIDFYLVGAVARDVWMNVINNLSASRITKDIDFAVLINDKDTYPQLVHYLISNEGFAPYKGNAFVLIWKDKTQVDLLPFGNIEDEYGKVTINGTVLTSISLQGFTEVYENGLPEINLEDKHQFKFCTIPGIVILKLIAYDDRPEIRGDDIKDICHLLQHYFEINSEKIYEHHNDLFGNQDAELIHIAAFVMGREMKTIAQRNPALKQRINIILQTNTTDANNSPIAIIMLQYFGNTVEDNIALLQHLTQGYTE